jgi:two-component system, cell cycle response regulator DivK
MSTSDETATPVILLADDYADAREMLALYLSVRGYRVEQAEDGQEAVTKALDLRPSVIVMDLLMPGMDGWAATRQLKGDPRTAGIPVINLTAQERWDTMGRAVRSGCDSFIAKPCDPEILVAEIARLLRKAGDGRRLPLASRSSI